MAYDLYNNFGSVTGAGDFKHDEYDLLGNKKTSSAIAYLDTHADNARMGLYEDNLARVVVIPTGTAPTGKFTVTLSESDSATGTYTSVSSRKFDVDAIKNGRSIIGMRCLLDFPAYHKRYLKLSVSVDTGGSVTGCTFLGYVDIGSDDDYSRSVGM